jgi:hypothetical protein
VCVRRLADVQRFEGADGSAVLSSFTGETRRRSLVLAGGVLAAWLFCAALLVVTR